MKILDLVLLELILRYTYVFINMDYFEFWIILFYKMYDIVFGI